MEWIADPQIWIALLTLSVLEIVLGIDNIVFIAILSGKLPPKEQKQARLIGLGLAMLMRIGLLFSISQMMRLTAPLFAILGNELSGRDLLLMIGGLFLIGKATFEVHHNLEGESGEASIKIRASLARIILQIVLLDAVFSLDSVITAVGMTEQLTIMVAAVIIAIAIMMLASGRISAFVHKHPTVKMLALSFLLLIGVSLIAEGLDQHIPKGYIYFAMAFSILVEMLNLRIRHRQRPVALRQRYTDAS